MAKPNIQFLKVTTNNEKLKLIASTIAQVFQQGKKILILMPSAQAAEFLDKYLWQISEESFLPHGISNVATNERIAITTVHENLNGAEVLLNLNPSISPLSHSFATIYDLEDLTSPEKAQLSKDRKLGYSNLL